MRFSPLLEQLIEAFRCLPGVGPKTAQRMAFHLLTRGRDNGKHLSQALLDAMQQIQHCDACRIFSETSLCEICTSDKRDVSLLCVVENAVDVAMIEQTGNYKGKYFVLLGHLSPLDGIGPDEVGMPKLKSHIAAGHIQEVVLATNTTVEGEATAHYISEIAKHHRVKVTRIARGIAIGSELEFIDPTTLAHAFAGREEVI